MTDDARSIQIQLLWRRYARRIAKAVRAVAIPASLVVIAAQVSSGVQVMEDAVQRTVGRTAEVLQRSDRIAECAVEFAYRIQKNGGDFAAQLIRKYGTGEAAFHSKELTQFRKVLKYYTRLETLLRLRHLSFDVVYGVVIFPDSFAFATKKLRRAIAEAYRPAWVAGVPKDLVEFDSAFMALQARYYRRRGGPWTDHADTIEKELRCRGR